MKFLNKKEQVLQIELTQYGKRLLSHGKFDPQFYAFFDDNILYDSEFAGAPEHQNEAHDRITKDTPQLDAQYIFSSIEEGVRKVNDMESESATRHALSAPLGTSAIEEHEAPSWSIKVLKGSISGSSDVITGSYPTEVIPQINVQPVIYKYEVLEGDALTTTELRDRKDFDPDDPEVGDAQTLNQPEGQDELGIGKRTLVEQFDDGNFLALYDDSIILEIEENNTPLDRENFEIEVYEVTTETTSDKIGSDREILKPLFFSRRTDLVQNDILLDPEEVAQGEDVSDSDPNYVEYFFNVKVDSEIEDFAFETVDRIRRNELYQPIGDDLDDVEECD